MENSMKYIFIILLLLLISKVMYVDIIKYEYLLNYIGYEYYGVNYFDEL